MDLIHSDTAGLSWYELCILNTAIRRMRTRTKKDQERALAKFGSEPSYVMKLALLDSIAATLTHFEKRLRRHYGLDTVEAFHVKEAQKLRADKVVMLSISKGDE